MTVTITKIKSLGTTEISVKPVDVILDADGNIKAVEIDNEILLIVAEDIMALTDKRIPKKHGGRK